MKYMIVGTHTDDNFGLLSLISGAVNLIKALDCDPEMLFYDSSPLDNRTGEQLEKMGLTIVNEKCQKKALVDAVLYRTGIKKSISNRLVEKLLDVDYVLDVYGIYFCNRFVKTEKNYLKILRFVFYIFGVCIIGRILGKTVVKTPASYGPVTQKSDIVSAKIAVRYIFNTMFAREKTGTMELKRVTKNDNIKVCPDLANLIPYESDKSSNEPMVGFAVSSQICKTWNKEQKYVDCMVKVIRHIICKHNCRVMLIPNEIHRTNPYNDMTLAKEIKTFFSDNDKVVLFDSEKEVFCSQRNIIASCDAVISGRYHSCVAALSAGVPTLVTGWHNKYTELMEHYGQSAYIVTDQTATAQEIIEKFDMLWAEREKISVTLDAKVDDIKGKIYSSFNGVFN